MINPNQSNIHEIKSNQISLLIIKLTPTLEKESHNTNVKRERERENKNRKNLVSNGQVSLTIVAIDCAMAGSLWLDASKPDGA